MVRREKNMAEEKAGTTFPYRRRSRNPVGNTEETTGLVLRGAALMRNGNVQQRLVKTWLSFVHAIPKQCWRGGA